MTWAERIGKLLGNVVSEGLRVYDETLANKFVPLGWIPDLNIGCKALDAVYKYLDQGNTVKAERFMRLFCIKRYNNELLDEVMEQWRENTLLKNRLDMLQQGIDAHKMGLYFASMPIFLSQLEGVVFEAKNYKGRSNHTILKQYFKDDQTFLYFRNTLNQFLNSFLFEKFEWGKKLKSPISRHAILHGYDTKYGTKANSIKLIMLFNLTQMALSGNENT